MYIDFKKNCKEYQKEAKKKGYQKYGFVEFQEFRGIVITSLQKLNNPLEELLYYKFVYQKKEMRFYHIATELKEVAISGIAILSFYMTVASMLGEHSMKYLSFGYALIMLYCGVEMSIFQYSKIDYFLCEIFASISERDLQ